MNIGKKLRSKFNLVSFILSVKQVPKIVNIFYISVITSCHCCLMNSKHKGNLNNGYEILPCLVAGDSPDKAY